MQTLPAPTRHLKLSRTPWAQTYPEASVAEVLPPTEAEVVKHVVAVQVVESLSESIDVGGYTSDIT